MAHILKHYGVLGMRWGIRRFQNRDGSLTPRGAARIERKDEKFVATRGEKIRARAQAATSKEMQNFVKNELNPRFKTNGKLTAATILSYNTKMATLMNNHIGTVSTPSGKVIKFVAKRGNVGVYTAYADAGYKMTNVKSGVFATGKVGYRNENVMKRY